MFDGDSLAPSRGRTSIAGCVSAAARPASIAFSKPDKRAHDRLVFGDRDMR